MVGLLERFGAGAVGLGGDGSVVTIPCASSVQIGDFVRVSGGILVRATASSLISAEVVGVVEFKNSQTSADLRVSGVMPSPYSGLVVGKLCFLGFDGRPTHTPPTGSGEVLFPIGKMVDAGLFSVQIGTRVVRA